MQKEIKQTWHFKQSPQEVWEYLTQPELIKQWLGETDFQPTVGHQFRFVSPYGNDSYCEVLAVKPYTHLSYSWQKNSAKDKQPFRSVVEWTLVPEEHGTTLQLWHHGFTAEEDTIGHRNGWNTCVEHMQELLNRH